MNKTVAFLAITGIIVCALAGVILILIIRPEASGTLIGFVGTMTAFALLAMATINGQAKLDKKVEQIAKNTNGTNDVLLRAAVGTGPLTIEEIQTIKGNAPGTTPAKERK